MQTDTVEKICASCGNIKPIDEYYNLKKWHDAYCKSCRKKVNQKNEVIRNLKIVTEQIRLYENIKLFPQFDFKEDYSVTIFTIFDRRLWPILIEYISEKHEITFNYKDIYIFLNKYNKYIYRYFSYKRCKCCKRFLMTYSRGDDPEYISMILSDPEIPLVPINFNRSNSTKDGWSMYCVFCNETSGE